MHRRVETLRPGRPFTYIGRLATLLALAALVSACGKPEKGVKVKAPPPPPPAPVEHVPPPEPEPEPAPATKPEDLGVVILSDLGLRTPESVLYVPELDVYLVSNINGSPLDKDDNGFLLKVSPNGESLGKLVDGAKDDVTLHAPKGLAVKDGVIYVADIDRVRTFDLATGAAKDEIALKGATFANDVALSGKGDLYVSDSGLKPDFSSSGTDAIWKVSAGKAKKIYSSKKFGGPNGLLAGEDGVWVATFGSGELSYITDKGKQEEVQKLPKGKNDGLVRTNDGRVLVSSWEGSAVLVGKPGGEFRELLSGLESPADIGYDSKRDRLLVPLFMKDQLVLQRLDALAPSTAAPASSGASTSATPTGASGTPTK